MQYKVIVSVFPQAKKPWIVVTVDNYRTVASYATKAAAMRRVRELNKAD